MPPTSPLASEQERPAPPGPREPVNADYSPRLIEAIRAVSRPLFRTLYRVELTGAGNIPAEGPAIIAPNHASYLDPWFISYSTRRPVHYLAWHGLFKVPLLNGMIRRCGAHPVDVDNPSDRRAWKFALRILEEGELLCIFPEGIRGYDGRLNPLQPGFARLSATTGAPIVPVRLGGTLEAWPRWQRLPRCFLPVSIDILPAIRPEQLPGARRERTEALAAAYRDAMIGPAVRQLTLETAAAHP